MPYPNEHAARVKSPTEFQKDSFKTKQIVPGVSAIVGKLKGKSEMTTQAYRFDKSKFTAQQARAWLKEHKISYIAFEAARMGS